MYKAKKFISLLLCCSMLFPAQGIYASSDLPEEGQVYQEYLPDAEPESQSISEENTQMFDGSGSSGEEEAKGYIRKNMPLQPLHSEAEQEWDGELVIYWNPEANDALLEEIEGNSTPSSATNSAAGVPFTAGSDHANGLTPATAVKSLNTAVRKAEQLSRRQGVDVADITIYAMRPMVIPEGSAYTVRGKGVTVAAWDGRSNGSDLVFAVAGGQLTLNNLVLMPSDGGTAPEDAETVYVKSGKLQLGEQVEVYGSFVMDYTGSSEVEWASESEATASGSTPQKDNEPVIELLKKFDAASEYVLDLRMDEERESVMAVRSLYSDTKSAAEFREMFIVKETLEDEWGLRVLAEDGGVLRDTTDEIDELATDSDADSEVLAAMSARARNADMELTQKSLEAYREPRSAGKIYWFPSDEPIIIDGVTYGPGIDIANDGRDESAPVRTWEQAVIEARNDKEIVYMATLQLSEDVSSFLGPKVGGSYVIQSSKADTMVVQPWEKNSLPLLVVPDGESVMFKNVTFKGLEIDRVNNHSGSQMLLMQGGQLIMEENVHTVNSYIQVDLIRANQSAAHPVIVNDENVDFNIYFAGIHHDSTWRYQDVVVAGDRMLAALGAVAAGEKLRENVTLEDANRITIPNGGKSKFAWELRIDQGFGSEPAKPSHLELYNTYYYDAVYVDGTRGDDADLFLYGASCMYPVKTFAAAKEIVIREMEFSRQARLEASQNNGDLSLIPYPQYIEVCGTMLVSGNDEVWELPTFYDYDGITEIKVEIRPHLDPLVPEGSTSALHSVPYTLVEVKGADIDLTLGNNMFVRSDYSNSRSTGIAVIEGATLKMEKNAQINSEGRTSISYTSGSNIVLGRPSTTSGSLSYGNFETSDQSGSEWTGAVRMAQYGIYSYGQNSRIRINGGTFSEHVTHAIRLLDGQAVMNGGSITKNTGNMGAGVYVIGSTAVFEFKKGSISENSYGVTTVYSNGPTVHISSRATFIMGTDGGAPDDCVIENNTVRTFYRGIGVYVQPDSTFTMKSGAIRNNKGGGSNYHAGNSTYRNYINYGGGIYSEGTVNIINGEITENGSNAEANANCKGAGIAIVGDAGQLEISAATIANNVTGDALSLANLYETTYTGGGGIYISSKNGAVIRNATIEDNMSYYGAGIYLDNTVALLELDGTIIQNNIGYTKLEHPGTVSYSGYGGGLCLYGDLQADNVQLINNWASVGGGAYQYFGDSRYVDGKFENNKASSGGGLYLSRQSVSNRASLAVKGTLFHLNSSNTGGAIYSAMNIPIWLNEVTIDENSASFHGGGIYSNNSVVYAVDTEITNNKVLYTAENYGGGGVCTSGGTFHLTETAPGKSALNNNTATGKGGGMYINGSTVVLGLTNTIQNQVTERTSGQGDNFYLTNYSNLSTNLYLMGGSYLQATADDVYNMYMDSASTGRVLAHLDMKNIVLEGDQAVFLNTSNNYLVYLSIPQHDTYKTMPINVNKEAFGIGSPVVKPADVGAVLYRQPNAGNTDLVTGFFVIAPQVQNAAVNMFYISGGILPERTELGGYRDTENAHHTNVVIVGQGVYLDGQNGDNDNDGKTPDRAVKTFEEAERKLRLYTDTANGEADGEGFSHFIYICGNVEVKTPELWNLDYDQDRYTDVDSRYVQYEAEQGRTVEKAQVKRFTSFLNAPLVTISESGKVTADKIIIDGMAESVDPTLQRGFSPVFEVGEQTSLILNGNAQIRNNYYSVIDVYGTLQLNGGQNDLNQQVEVTAGTGVTVLKNGHAEMNGDSRIVFLDQPIYSDIRSINSYQLDAKCGRGVALKSDEGSPMLTMNGNSKIESLNGSLESVIGVVLGTAQDNVYQARLVMNDNSEIKHLYAGIAFMRNGSSVMLNDYSTIGDRTNVEDGNKVGIYAYSHLGYRAELTMNDHSMISYNQWQGIYFDWQSSSAGNEVLDAVNITMTGDSTIRSNGEAGIQLYNFWPKVQIDMSGRSSIVNNNKAGIYEYYSAHRNMVVNMREDSWMGSQDGGVQNYGIHMASDNTSTYQNRHLEINLLDRALIGGDEPYNVTSGTARRGNRYAGIHFNWAADINMGGSSKIAYNGIDALAGQLYGGIIFNSQSSVYRGSGTVTLSGNASIANNWGYGIYSNCYLENVADWTENFLIRENASIKDNNYGSFFSLGDSVYLQDTAFIGRPNYAGVYRSEGHTIEITGKLFMAGTVDIEGFTYLKNHRHPITLTTAVPGHAMQKKYQLYLAEGFLSKIVVKPDVPNLADATPYQQYFDKVGGEGLAAEKMLRPEGINIVLEGENNVYLSGNGNDANDGMSPSTAVRTFKQARELLTTGYYTEGANILICDVPGETPNTPVVIGQYTSTDTDWSFGTDGYITNTHPDTNGARWKPVVAREKDYLGMLIRIEYSTSIHVVFKNITIDGRGDLDHVAASSLRKSILHMTSGRATLGEGAVFRNNRISSRITTREQAALGVYLDNGSASGIGAFFYLDGGTIEDLTLEDGYLSNNYGQPAGVAIGTRDGSTIHIKDGIIRNISVRDNNASSNARYGVVVAYYDSRLMIEGGSIINNSITGASANLFGSAVIVDISVNKPVLKSEITGGLISNNVGMKGSAIYYVRGMFELSGGRIRNNVKYNTAESIKIDSPVYVNHNQFSLKGGGCIIDDPIYLSNTNNLITVSGNIYQSSRRYVLYVSSVFNQGSVVVQPDGEFVQNATPFLGNFEVRDNPFILDQGYSATKNGGTIAGVKQNQCLILMKAVFLDSTPGKGSDANGGLLPSQAVQTFERAKAVGQAGVTAALQNYYVIYTCGPATNKDGEVWTLEEEAYMCRYTGFDVYNPSGKPERNASYYGYMIETGGSLVLDGGRYFGRRVQDGSEHIGESILKVNSSHLAIIKEGTTFSRNTNEGNYYIDDNLVSLTMNGGAITVANGGQLQMLGGTISNTTAVRGNAIYQDANSADGALPEDFGRLLLDGGPHIGGDIYLNGKLYAGEAYLEVTDRYQPPSGEVLRVRIANDRNSRPVVKYQADGNPPTTEQIKYYKLDDSVLAIYEFGARMGDSHVLELQQRQIIYVDNGINGNDSNSGLTPEEAVHTLEGVYRRIKEMDATMGVLVYVMNPLTIESNETVTLTNRAYVKSGNMVYEGAYQKDGTLPIEIDAQVTFKRYVKPTSTTASGYDRPTFEGAMFVVERDAAFLLEGMYFDGHSEDTVSSFDFLQTMGIEAQGPLLRVEPGGIVDAYPTVTESKPAVGADPGQTGATTYTTFSNAKNGLAKLGDAYKLGENAEGEDVYEGSSAAIEIIGIKDDYQDAATCTLNNVLFNNLALGNGVNGGSDVYNNGILIVSRETNFTGTVMLEGVGTEYNSASSRYIMMGAYGKPVKDKFNLLIRDAYPGRKVVEFPNLSERPDGPNDTEIGFYLLESRVSQYYSLMKRTPERYILELQVPRAVYVDGRSGNDGNDGWKPNAPVRSMAKAYDKLRSIGGKVIYVVGTVEINSVVEINSNKYEDASQTINLLSNADHVDIRRYVKPVAAANDPDYRVDTCMDPLFEIKSGGVLTLNNEIYIDGHYSPKTDVAFKEEFRVAESTEVTSPLIHVKSGGMLRLQTGSLLYDNYSTAEKAGAVLNEGTLELDGGVLKDNVAQKGAGVYQQGYMEILKYPEGIVGQEIYLHTPKSGTDENPVWGSDSVLHTAVLMRPGIQLSLRMDHPVAGRPVVKYTMHSSVDAQHVHYPLPVSNVPADLFLVESELDDSLLELQDWRILDVEVPEEIFLVVQQTRTGVIDLKDGAVAGMVLGSPEYAVRNRGGHNAKITMVGFVNRNTEMGITGFDQMNLVSSPAAALLDTASRKDFYLAIEGTDTVNGFSGVAETSLDAYGTVGGSELLMGILPAGEAGNFKFKATAGRKFVSYYEDSLFPFFGTAITADDRKNHMRNRTIDQNTNEVSVSANYARAAYEMIYRVEIEPARR